MTRFKLFVTLTTLTASAALASAPDPAKNERKAQLFADHVAKARAAHSDGRAEDAIEAYERAVRKARRGATDPQRCWLIL